MAIQDRTIDFSKEDVIGSHRKYCGVLYFTQQRLFLDQIHLELTVPKKMTLNLSNVICQS